jgi:hypothetical protein
MPHHFSKSTVEASVWCNPCGRETPHSIADGRRGSCLVCLKKLEDAPKAEALPPIAEQKEMF